MGVSGRLARVDAGPLVVMLGPLIVVVLAAYGVATGISHAAWFISLAVLSVVVTGMVVSISSRSPVLGAPQSSAEIVAAIGGAVTSPILLFGFTAFLLEGSILPVSLVLAIQVLVAAYTLPRPLRIPLQVWAIAPFFAAVWLAGIRSTTTWSLQIVGVVVLVAAVWRAVERQDGASAIARASTGDAQAMDEMLVSVLGVDSLDPHAVLAAVVDGLYSLGFATVVIRRAEPAEGIARLIVGRTTLDIDIDEEMPLDEGLPGEVFERGETIVLDRYDEHPRARERGRGYQGAILIPLVLGDGGRGVLAATSTAGPLTAVQRQGVERLVGHASGSLRRATSFEVDAQVVAELRRLEERTQDFVSTVSHELRTPLTVIAGLGQTLRDRWSILDDGRREDLLQRIEANADRLSVMVRSLLDTSALDRGQLDLVPEATLLHPMLVRLLDRLATVTATHPIDVDIPEGLEVVVDPGLFEHVIENLLTNVAKHTPQGTPVIVRAHRQREVVEVSISDRGPGIAPHDLPHVLDRFYRGGEPTRRETGGLGLGLALAQQIVSAHGSQLTVTSDPGEGTVFTFQVPSA